MKSANDRTRRAPESGSYGCRLRESPEVVLTRLENFRGIRVSYFHSGRLILKYQPICKTSIAKAHNAGVVAEYIQARVLEIHVMQCKSTPC